MNERQDRGFCEPSGGQGTRGAPLKSHVDARPDGSALAAIASRRLSDVPDGPFRRRLEQSINLLTNYTRGAVAEVVVAELLGGELVGEGYGSWDIDVDGVRVEVKATGDIQSWPQTRPSTPTFSVARAAGWIEQSNGSFIADPTKERRNDVYVFCHHRGTRPDVISEWDFYVCATSRIDEVLGDAKTVGLSALKARFGLEQLASEDLPQAVRAAREEASG